VLAGLCVAALIGGVATVFSTGRSFSEPGTNMENTVVPGDTVLTDRTAQVHRGDVIVDEEPSNGPEYHIRRVIGLPGDHVACCDGQGRITVNGTALDETYLYPGDAPARYPVNAPSSALFSVTVPAGKFWLMGDHRSRARDSRTEGALAVRVVGRVFLIERSGHAILLRTPQAFSASGLAPASEPVPAAVIGTGVACVALILLLALAIFGTVRLVLRGRGRTGPPQPQPVREWQGGAQP
jgi:signal peptidase I